LVQASPFTSRWASTSRIVGPPPSGATGCTVMTAFARWSGFAFATTGASTRAFHEWLGVGAVTGGSGGRSSSARAVPAMAPSAMAAATMSRSSTPWGRWTPAVVP